MHGRVHVQHHQPLLGQHVLGLVHDEGAASSRRVELVVAVHGDDVLVAGHGPEAPPVLLRVPEDRGLVSEHLEHLVGDALHIGVPIDEIDLAQLHVPSIARGRTCPCPDMTAIGR